MEASGCLVGALEGSGGTLLEKLFTLGQLQGTEAGRQTGEVPGILVSAPGFGLFVGLAGQDLPEAGEDDGTLSLSVPSPSPACSRQCSA